MSRSGRIGAHLAPRRDPAFRRGLPERLQLGHCDRFWPTCWPDSPRCRWRHAQSEPRRTRPWLPRTTATSSAVIGREASAMSSSPAQKRFKPDARARRADRDGLLRMRLAELGGHFHGDGMDRTGAIDHDRRTCGHRGRAAGSQSETDGHNYATQPRSGVQASRHASRSTSLPCNSDRLRSWSERAWLACYGCSRGAWYLARVRATTSGRSMTRT